MQHCGCPHLWPLDEIEFDEKIKLDLNIYALNNIALKDILANNDGLHLLWMQHCGCPHLGPLCNEAPGKSWKCGNFDWTLIMPCIMPSYNYIHLINILWKKKKTFPYNLLCTSKMVWFVRKFQYYNLMIIRIWLIKIARWHRYGLIFLVLQILKFDQ